LWLSLGPDGPESEFILYDGITRSPITTDGQIRIFEASVVGRYVFYNDSAFDGNDQAANAADDNAVATDKTALLPLPGQTAAFANYTSSVNGINGIMIDIEGLPTGVTPEAGDFLFRVGNDDNPAAWTDAPTPTAVALRKGAGIDGSDRISIIWDDYAIRNTWLEVTVLAERLGSAEDDVSCFGNAVDVCSPEEAVVLS